MRRLVSEGGSFTDKDDEEPLYFSPCTSSVKGGFGVEVHLSEDELVLLEEGYVPYQSSLISAEFNCSKKKNVKSQKHEVNTPLLQKDPMMEMFLGKSEGNDDDDDDDDYDGNDTFRKSRNQVVGLLSKFGDVVKQSRQSFSSASSCTGRSSGARPNEGYSREHSFIHGRSTSRGKITT